MVRACTAWTIRAFSDSVVTMTTGMVFPMALIYFRASKLDLLGMIQSSSTRSYSFDEHMVTASSPSASWFISTMSKRPRAPIATFYITFDLWRLMRVSVVTRD